MRLVVFSDIHGNLSAIKVVLDDIKQKYNVDGIALLGDIIDYGPRPNQVISILESLSVPIICNLFGNHERALFSNDLTRFSSDRGRRSLLYTRSILDDHSFAYIKRMNSCAMSVVTIDEKRILFVHGDLSDPYWGKLPFDEMQDEKYAQFDYVFSGHTHTPRLEEMYYKCDNNSKMRDRHRTIFINPGSVGQPRNHNRRAQYLYIDFESETIHFNAVEYDVDNEIAMFSDKIDGFYAERLLYGI